MANKGYSDKHRRFDPSGPTATVERKHSTPSPGPDNNQAFFGPQTIGAQSADCGWHNLDLPSGNEGLADPKQMNHQPDGYAGGDAGSGGKYTPAAYPGKTLD